MPAASISSILQHYERNYRKRRDDELAYFEEQPTLKSAISKAALAEGPGARRLKHQRRLRQTDLQRAHAALVAREAEIQNAKSFDELHEIVLIAAKSVWKNPELYAYDTAARIGAKLNLCPDKVYLHSGTRVGARNLGLNASGRSLSVAELPNEFQGMEPSSIEDILCIYKAKFLKKPKT